MSKKKYISPELNMEELKVDASFALGCGTSTPFNVVGCLEKTAPDDYEVLTEIWGFGPDYPLDALGAVIYSSDKTCKSSCYQGPYDSFFNS